METPAINITTSKLRTRRCVYNYDKNNEFDFYSFKVYVVGYLSVLIFCFSDRGYYNIRRIPLY